MSTTLILKNKNLQFLISYLSKLTLAGNDSRQRSRFIELLTRRALEIDEERIKILEKYSKKDKEGKSIKIKTQTKNEKDELVETEVYDLSTEGTASLQKEFDVYLNEEFVIDILEGNKEKIRKTKEILLNSTIPIQGIDATLYNECCDAFEKVKFEK